MIIDFQFVTSRGLGYIFMRPGQAALRAVFERLCTSVCLSVCIVRAPKSETNYEQKNGNDGNILHSRPTVKPSRVRCSQTAGSGASDGFNAHCKLLIVRLS